MANIKSAKKRVLVSQAKAERNKSARSKVKTDVYKRQDLHQEGRERCCCR